MAIVEWLQDIGPSILAFIINILIAVLIWYVGKWIIGHVTVFLRRSLAMNKSMDKTLAGFVESIATFAMKFILIIVVLGQVGIENTQFVAIAGAAVFAIAFALQGALSNFAAGVMLLTLKFLQSGDYVTAGGETGHVKAIELFTTKLLTEQGHYIIIPNAEITENPITNMTTLKRLRLDLKFVVDANDDWALAKEIIFDVMEEDERVLSKPLPRVVVEKFDESEILLCAMPWCETEHQDELKYDLVERVMERFEDSGLGYEDGELPEDEQTGGAGPGSDGDPTEAILPRVGAASDEIESAAASQDPSRAPSARGSTRPSPRKRGVAESDSEDEAEKERLRRARAQSTHSAFSSEALQALKKKTKKKGGKHKKSHLSTKNKQQATNAKRAVLMSAPKAAPHL